MANGDNGWWKAIAVSLSTVVIAGLSFWLAEGRHYVSRNEVKTMIEEHSPYTRDRAFVKETMRANKELNATILSEIKSLQKEIVEIKVQMASYLRRMSVNQQGNGS